MSIDLHFPPDLEQLRAVWLRFARDECGTYTPLYRSICETVADRAEVLQVTADGPSHARQPNLLLAAVHALVLRHRASGPATRDPALDRLCEIYESGRSDDAGEGFVDVVLSHRDEVARLLATRFTQTNECGRSAPLSLALHSVAESYVGTGAGPAGLALIDAGCSAGLNLAVDRYRIDFGDDGAFGPSGGPLVASELRGPHVHSMLPLPESLVCIGWRVGLERAPVDLSDDEAVTWMQACLWPDQPHRLERAAQAFTQLRSNPPRIEQGDMVDDLTSLIDQAPADLLVTVLTSWAAAYLRPADRERLVEVLRAASVNRPIVWLSMEFPGVAPGLALPDFTVDTPTSPSLVGALHFDRGEIEPRTIGWTHPHGAWFAPAASPV
ncbi:MAG: DUF2332 domain-containing protein [Acidimicrobiales bacterium]